MAINIDKIIKTNFDIVEAGRSIGSYKKVLFVTQSDLDNKTSDARSVFKNCGGDENDVLELEIDGTAITINNLAEKILEKKQNVSGTDSDFIFVCLDSNLSQTVTTTFLDAIEQFTAPYRVCVCVSLAYTSGGVTNLFNPYNVAIKLYPELNTNAEVCLSIPAYYSQLNLTYNNIMADYAYTPEPAQLTKNNWISNADFETLLENCNFVETIGNQRVNFGGNLANGTTITGYFGSIAVENDITFAVLNGMLQKQPLNSAGLNNIIALINQSITKYINNGYLEQNSTWTGKDYIISHGKYKATAIKNGAKLPEGFYVAKVPMSYITPEYKAERKFTPIRVFMQSLAGARVVEIDGSIVE